MDISPRPPGSGSQPIKRTVGFSIAGDEEGEEGGIPFDGLDGEGMDGGGMDGLGAVGSPSPVLITPHFDGPATSLGNSDGSGSVDDTRSVRQRVQCIHFTLPVTTERV
jgi:hypothetical protein